MKLIILFIVLITWVIALFLIFKYKNLIKDTLHLNIKIKDVNKQLEDKNNNLKKQHEELQFKKDQLQENIKTINELIKEESVKLTDLQQNIILVSNTQKELSQNAFENYCEILDKSYQEKEEEYDAHILLLKQSYQHLQDNLIKQTEIEKAELDKIKATRIAAQEAQLKEKEIKEKISFYCLSIKQTDLDDIRIIERIKTQLHNPRILSMLIWSTYFQKPMTNLCNNIIGTEIKSGIYKITNQKTNLCYIGQAVDLARRWKDHAKCGLGIDTPASNKLYQSMIEDGIWNFSFEVLEECPREQLNEKEKYYINLYDSKNYGYNVTKGNN